MKDDLSPEHRKIERHIINQVINNTTTEKAADNPASARVISVSLSLLPASP